MWREAGREDACGRRKARQEEWKEGKRWMRGVNRRKDVKRGMGGIHRRDGKRKMRRISRIKEERCEGRKEREEGKTGRMRGKESEGRRGKSEKKM